MTAEQLEIFHQSLLRVLDASAGRQFGLGAQALQVLVGQYGFAAVKQPDVEAAMHYLADKEIGFVEPVDKGQFNPANVSWRITARGINHLRHRGL